MSKHFMNFRKNKGAFRLLSGIAKYQQFAGNIVDDDHKDAGNQLHNISIPAEQVYCQKNDAGFQHSGCNPGTNKFAKFRNDGFCRPIVAAKYKGLIGQICKSNGSNPRNHVADCSAEGQQIIARQINNVVYNGGQHSEKQVGHNVPVFLYKINDFIHDESPIVMLPVVYHNLPVDARYVIDYNQDLTLKSHFVDFNY